MLVALPRCPARFHPCILLTRSAYLPKQDCEDAAKWAGHEAIAEGLLHPGASWRHYRCFKRELPPLDSLAQLDGVLISGSHYSAYEGKRKGRAQC